MSDVLRAVANLLKQDFATAIGADLRALIHTDLADAGQRSA